MKNLIAAIAVLAVLALLMLVLLQIEQRETEAKQVITRLVRENDSLKTQLRVYEYIERARNAK